MNRRWLFAAATACVASFAPPSVGDARAEDPPPAARTSPASAAPAPDAGAPVVTRAGLAVLAVGTAGAPAWTLAQSIYANESLRPASLDEAHARVLTGEPAPASTAPDLKDLADTRGAIRGDDAPSRALLASIANTFHVRGIVVVEMNAAAHPSARVFVMGATDAGTFDAARYEPDAPAASSAPSVVVDGGASLGVVAAPTIAVTWNGAATSIARAFSQPSIAMTPPALAISAPALATSSVPDAPRDADAGAKHGTPFYKSPWFWGAIGAAAFGTTAIYFATRDNSSGTIHLELQAPK